MKTNTHHTIFDLLIQFFSYHSFLLDVMNEWLSYWYQMKVTDVSLFNWICDCWGSDLGKTIWWKGIWIINLSCIIPNCEFFILGWKVCQGNTCSLQVNDEIFISLLNYYSVIIFIYCLILYDCALLGFFQIKPLFKKHLWNV